MRVFNMAFFQPMPRVGALLGLAMAAFCPTAFLPTGAFAIDPFAPDAYGTYQANVENGKVLFGAAGCGACDDEQSPSATRLANAMQRSGETVMARSPERTCGHPTRRARRHA